MVKELRLQVEDKMKKTVERFANELTGIRTGRASASILEGIKVENYGVMVPINQVANISIPEPRLLEIRPWDKNILSEIEKSITKSNIGIHPVNDGRVIRLPIPPLTEERRKDLAKNIRKTAENYKIVVRNERRSVIEEAKKIQKDKKITEDEERNFENEIQKMTESYIKKIDELVARKDKEIMEV